MPSDPYFGNRHHNLEIPAPHLFRTEAPDV